MRDPPHKEMTAYGCWLSPLTRFAGLHCGGLSSEAGAYMPATMYFLRFALRIVNLPSMLLLDRDFWQLDTA